MPDGGLDPNSIITPTVEQAALALPWTATHPYAPGTITPNTPSALPPKRKPSIPQPKHYGRPPADAPMYGGYAAGGAPAATSLVTPVSSNPQTFDTMPPTTLQSSFTPPSQPFSSYVADALPMSALSGGAGSNGLIASVNNMGIPSGAPHAPISSTPSSLAPPMPSPTSGTAGGPTPQLYGQNGGFYGLLNSTGTAWAPSSGISGAYNGNLFTQAPGFKEWEGGQPTYLPYTATVNAARGGEMAAGGLPPMSGMAPWYMRREAAGAGHAPSGLLGGKTGGRTDVLPIAVAAGSHVIPSDILSGLGDGNSESGAHIMDMITHSLPYGIQGGKGGKGGIGIPKPPRMAKISRGGEPQDKGEERVPIIAAAGEKILSPDEVKAWGNGDLDHGHKVLNHFIMHMRKKTIEDLKGLKPPKGFKKNQS